MSESRPLRPVEILLVEDNPGDVELAREALRESKVINNLHVVTDGEKALQFLRRIPPYASVPEPDVILLDLNLPRMDGREVLAEIKADEQLRHIPVVVLTTSRSEEDVLQSYDLHANCFITKPLELGRFVEVVKSIEDFWLSIVVLPNRRV
jgi:chemotaxis family two-component system response regulator Rcp1